MLSVKPPRRLALLCACSQYGEKSCAVQKRRHLKGGALEKRSLCCKYARKSIAAFVGVVLSLCLVSALAFQGVQKAQAAPLDLSKSCTVQIALSGTDEQPADLGLHYKLYKVAAVEQQPGYDAYTYAATNAFAALGPEVDWLASAATASGYKALAQSAAALIVDAAESGAPVAADYDYDAAAAAAAQAVAPGLYLLVAYGADTLSENLATTNVLVPNQNAAEEGASKYVSTAFSNSKRYDFAPEVVALPTKAQNGHGGSSNSADLTEWVYDPTFTLKPAVTDRVGSLEINKRLLEFEQTEGVAGNEATFVFEIKGYATRDDAIAAQANPDIKPVYSNVASITFNATGSNKAVVQNIPAGLYVVVTEVYSGTSYQPVSSQQPQEGYIVATDNAAIEVLPTALNFENTYNGNANKGGSVTNSFQFGENEEWVWSKNGEAQTGGAAQGGE